MQKVLQSTCLGFKVTLHTIRHTFAAHLAQKAMLLECIRVLLGLKLLMKLIIMNDYIIMRVKKLAFGQIYDS